jgi:hypothetical protein
MNSQVSQFITNEIELGLYNPETYDKYKMYCKLSYYYRLHHQKIPLHLHHNHNQMNLPNTRESSFLLSDYSVGAL